MKTIPLTFIQISDNRQRRNFDLKELNELGESIKRIGLLHPIVLRYESCEPTIGETDVHDGDWILVSGERRLRALSDIYALGGTIRYDSSDVPAGEVPYVDLGELDELAREEAELDENIKRKDLTWQEKAQASARLSALRGRQAGVAGLPPPPIAVIAEEVRGSSKGVHQELTRREIIVAKHLDDPEVKGAKDVDEAFKILRRKEDTAKRVLHAAEVGKTYSAETAHTVLNEDSLLWMSAAEAEQFDVICTDPIYGIGADEFGDSGGRATGAHFYEDSYEKWKADITTLAREGFRITKTKAHLYAFCDITRFEEFKAILAAAGWSPFRTPIIWHKPNGNRTPWVDSGPQRKYELILYAKKGGRPVTRIYPDLVTYAADENLGHPAQKPVALFIDLLRRSCGAGERILDPFAGSGPALVAGQELKLRVTALEGDAAAYALCVKRLDALKAQPELAGLE